MQRVISFHYTLTDSSGKRLDSSAGGEPFSFMEGVMQIVPGLERELTALEPGTKKRIPVAAQDAYGVKKDDLIVTVAKSQMPSGGSDISIGDRFKGGAEDHAPIFTVTHLTDTDVTLDANHPLAGVDLVFDVEITGIRPATDEEIAHGHAHGPEGHGHHH
ncbi:MAG: peptidylprolyl isomerase [Candidatus Omnitrophica bacterium]|nr:peptidylprolyl isomerase [Candidatus Omnitrophota bacterium]